MQCTTAQLDDAFIPPKDCFPTFSRLNSGGRLDDSNWLGSQEATSGAIHGGAAKAVLFFEAG
jgi:hypothetical protein